MQIFTKDPILPPRQANPTFSRALAAGGEVCATPDSWKGKTVRFYADGGDFKLMFGESSSVTCVANSSGVSTRDGTTFVLSPLNGSAPTVAKDWSFIDLYVGPNDNFFHVLGAASAGYWHAHVTSAFEVARSGNR